MEFHRKASRKAWGGILLLLFALLMFSGCAITGESAAYRDARLHVVTTIFPPYDFTRNIAGETEGVYVQQLLRPGTESHTFDPTPADILAVQNCDVFIYTGGESDQWVDTLLAAVDNEHMTILRMIDLVDAVEEGDIEGSSHHHDHAHDKEDTHEHAVDSDHVEYDEHVWTDPHNAMHITQAIADTLCALDTAYADTYRKNCALYLEKLSALDKTLHDIAEDAVHRTMVFGDRFPFRYLCDAYGLGYRAAFPGCAAESEPSAATMIYLIDKVKEEQIPAVLTIEMSNGKIASAIAEETGAQILQMHSCHNRTAAEAELDLGYLALMYQNAEIMKIALGTAEEQAEDMTS